MNVRRFPHTGMQSCTYKADTTTAPPHHYLQKSTQKRFTFHASDQHYRMYSLID
jgi:hypothetical protein